MSSKTTVPGPSSQSRGETAGVSSDRIPARCPTTLTGGLDDEASSRCDPRDAAQEQIGCRFAVRHFGGAKDPTGTDQEAGQSEGETQLVVGTARRRRKAQ